jgi:hypothetical protein
MLNICLSMSYSTFIDLDWSTENTLTDIWHDCLLNIFLPRSTCVNLCLCAVIRLISFSILSGIILQASSTVIVNWIDKEISGNKAEVAVMLTPY